MAPILEELRTEYEGRLDVEFVDLSRGQRFRFCVFINRLPRLRLLHIELPVGPLEPAFGEEPLVSGPVDLHE